MSTRILGKLDDVGRFRRKLLLAMMLVVVVMAALGLYLAQRKVAIEARLDLAEDFRNKLDALHGVQQMRHDALAERCRELVKSPRLHAALEDNALDLLYPSALDELRGLVEREGSRLSETPDEKMHPKFYRFLDEHGALIPPPHPAEVGELPPEEEAQLTLPRISGEQQIGYLVERRSERLQIDELIAIPITSMQSGRPLAMLVLAFAPAKLNSPPSPAEIRSGIWLGARLDAPALSEDERRAVSERVGQAITSPGNPPNNLPLVLGGVPHLLFYKKLNPNSLYPPAYEVALYPFTAALARQARIRWQVLVSGAGLLLLGLGASHFLARGLAQPVEKLAVTSQQDRVQRRRVEAALETTQEELQRAARFSADASHQLKTPVTVLRAGIDGLLARENFPAEVYHELSALLHQTYRITSVIDDLLLLSRLDAGRLQINFDTVDLSRLLEEWIDDLSALPDDLHVRVETNFPPGLKIAGERTYVALIVQNLLENARKYNVAGGSICVSAHEQGDDIYLCVENTARPIPPAAQKHIFERFHRGGVGENIPGHGLGLNLARELARLHGGDLRLVRSDAECTEFEVRFRVARAAARMLAESK